VLKLTFGLVTCLSKSLKTNYKIRVRKQENKHSISALIILLYYILVSGYTPLAEFLFTETVSPATQFVRTI
jgi:hypothetical protein